MPHGKPAGQRCVQLDEYNLCRIFAMPQRPAVCASLRAENAMCGENAAQALAWLERLEIATRPDIVDATAL